MFHIVAYRHLVRIALPRVGHPWGHGASLGVTVVTLGGTTSPLARKLDDRFFTPHGMIDHHLHAYRTENAKHTVGIWLFPSSRTDRLGELDSVIAYRCHPGGRRRGGGQIMTAFDSTPVDWGVHAHQICTAKVPTE